MPDDVAAEKSQILEKLGAEVIKGEFIETRLRLYGWRN